MHPIDPHHRNPVLSLLIRGCELHWVRSLANRFCLNKVSVLKSQIVETVSTAVTAHYREHHIEMAVVARQARAYQKFYFRQRLQRLKEQIEAEQDTERARRWRRLIRYYKTEINTLNACRDSSEVISHLARYYAEDMAADLNPAFFAVFKQIARRLFPHFVAGIRAEGEYPQTLQRVREVAGRAPILYVPNHISNADHIPICFALNQLGIRQPRIAAGANLFRGLSSHIMPRLNAYKIRREQIGASTSWLGNIRWFQNPVYRRVHAEYLRNGWDRDEALLFYIEGTRSRDGTVGRPKLGILAEALEFARENQREFFAVPISVSYTVVPEDREIEASRTGTNISDKDLITQLTELDRSYRNFAEAPIHVRFADPIPLYGDDKGIEDLTDLVMQRILEGIRLTDTSVLAACLLAAAREQGDNESLIEKQQIQQQWQSAFGTAPEYADADIPSHLEASLNIFTVRGFIEKDTIPGRYRIVNAALLRQYANRITHRFPHL